MRTCDTLGVDLRRWRGRGHGQGGHAEGFAWSTREGRSRGPKERRESPALYLPVPWHLGPFSARHGGVLSAHSKCRGRFNGHTPGHGRRSGHIPRPKVSGAAYIVQGLLPGCRPSPVIPSERSESRDLPRSGLPTPSPARRRVFPSSESKGSGVSRALRGRQAERRDRAVGQVQRWSLVM